MRTRTTLLLCLWALVSPALAQPVQDDFEGNGTIETWAEDDCELDDSLPNPFSNATNSSATVLEYHDIGGQYANVYFDVPANFDLSENHTFFFKIYVPSSGLTGSAPNQVSLKLQDGLLPQPWATQSEIIKPLSLDQWQTVTFDFENDSYINLDGGSPPPTQRTDFNRVLIQINGENNNDQVLAYIDDFAYDGIIEVDTSGNSNPDFDQLVWADEFDSDGPIDASRWFHQTLLPLGTSWYNGEIQHYTDRIENSYVENGTLHIVAKRETFTDQGETKEFTSARLNSRYVFTYGRVEVRAKLPTGPGTWPAIWTLGQNIDEPGGYWETQGLGTTPWPQCGEIDIMEHWGTNQNHVSSATHTPSSFGGTVNTAGQFIATASTAFHVYTLDWYPDKLVFAVDGNEHFTYEPEVRDADTWPFDAPQYILFNVAMLSAVEPAFTESAMEIDYIRIYQSSNTTGIEQHDAHVLTAYPNPIGDMLQFELPSIPERSISIQVYDHQGKVVRSDSVNPSGRMVSVRELDSLPAGNYLARIEVGEQRYTLRFLKE